MLKPTTSAVSIQPNLELGGKLPSASQWVLMWWKLKKHRLALVGGGTIIFFYLIAAFSPFIAPYGPQERTDLLYLPPQAVHWIDPARPGIHPFVYGIARQRDPDSYALIFTVVKEEKYDVHFFVHGIRYRLLGIFPADIHLFGVDGKMRLSLFGNDQYGRDVFSRCLLASTISLSIGLVGITSSFVIGIILGGISGFYGGSIDTIIQQSIIFLSSLPTIPVWMALSAALPPHWPPIKVYFGITIILSIIGWTGLARVIRGRMLQLREEDFVIAARLAGTSDLNLIFQHLLPSCMSYLIVSITLAIPGMILGETALSFLGLGMREPAISWGVLLQQSQNVRTVALYPWLMTPALMVILVVLAFNFLGDGLRDAADPYAN
jgi:peptide/nickel transport system permease protein